MSQNHGDSIVQSFQRKNDGDLPVKKITTGKYQCGFGEMRGIFPSLDVIKQSVAHLSMMNQGKRGHPFVYPGLFIDWMACYRVMDV